MTSEDPSVTTLRQFNRRWTRQAGLLRAGLLDTPHSLTEARILYEVATRGQVELAELRRDLDLDAGFASRVVQRLEGAGLVTTSMSSDDARRKRLELTEAGRVAFDTLDARADAQAADMLAAFAPDERRELVRAMRTILRLLDPPADAAPFVLRPLRAGELGWVVQRHGRLYADEYGWDQRFEGLVARIVADYVEGHDQHAENAWIAERHGEPVGCVFCTRKDEATAQLRLLLVEPSARGLGLGSHLVTECVRFARHAGYRRMMLWTNDVLVAARRIYEAHGFVLTDSHEHRDFGVPLTGQHWELDLEEARDVL